jgi:hypothetical protein
MARSYRLARRAFLAGIGGACGLKVLLRNLEAAAEGGQSPPRFMLAHWPMGTLRYRFLPSGTASPYVASPILQPFEDAGLRADMTAFFGFSDIGLTCPGGGGFEAGTPFTTTCCSSEGTRANGGESDDAVAGGPSFDQVFLKHVAGLDTPGVRHVNAICDARVDSYETSSQCLSYSYDSRSIESAVGGAITEYVPLLPTLAPAALYAQLFSGLMPGGTTPANQAAALEALQLRKSVLDHALEELKQLKALAPSAEAPKIEMHEQALRKLEQDLAGMPQTGEGGCTVPTSPSVVLQGKSGNSPIFGTMLEDDTVTHRAVAEAHLAIILAAFQCDLMRVATFQFAPGNDHVAFKGLWPNEPERLATLYSESGKGTFLAGAAMSDPSLLSGTDRDRYEFLANVYTWYNQRLADWLKKLKTTEDVFGNNLLDTTIVPYVSEIAQVNRSRSPKPALLFGGAKLGLQHGTFQDFSSAARPQVDLYLTCAQALLQTADPLSVLGDERFVQFNPTGAPIAGLWAAPV